MKITHIVTALFALVLASLAVGQPTYSLTDLGTLSSDNHSEGASLNDSSQVVGTSTNTATNLNRAFLWSLGSSQQLVGLGSNLDRALSVNGSALAVGLSRNLSGNIRAVLWELGAIQDLGTLGGDSSVANSVNDSGQITGWAQALDGSQHAFLWQSGIMQDLGTFGGGYSVGVRINANGQVAGFYQSPSGFNHAFLWENGSMLDLGTLPGHVRSDAQGLNDLGEVVGLSFDVNGFYRPFLWSSGVMQDIDLLPGAILGSSGGINNSGVIVGTMIFSGSPSAGFVRHNGVTHNLNNLLDSTGDGWQVVFASAINNSGVITGNAINPVGELRAVLLTPLPTTQTFGSAADSYVKEGQPNKNQGTEGILRIRQSGQNRSLVQFDQSAIDTFVGNRAVTSATLRIYISLNSNNWGMSGRDVSAHRMTTDWTELGATWNCPNDVNTGNNAPDGIQWEMGNASLWPFVSTPSDTVLHTNGLVGWIEFDVTTDVQGFLSGNPNFGWLIKKVNENQAGSVEYSSKEGLNPPELVIVAQ